jgi:hypothetical protein
MTASNPSSACLLFKLDPIKFSAFRQGHPEEPNEHGGNLDVDPAGKASADASKFLNFKFHARDGSSAKPRVSPEGCLQLANRQFHKPQTQGKFRCVTLRAKPGSGVF